ncbi:cytochrome P450 4C1-like isoform X2 [Rhodnius prolixus]|uniref:cytochrome P450 4C1-like isoform X2 n=1 Tax=Rhodnius prolixus TaxID=13249 RepID=UPI003D18F40C
MILLIILAVIVSPLTYYLVKTLLWIQRASKMIKNIAGPKTLPLIGNGLIFVKMKHLHDMFDIIKDLLDEYGEGIGKIVRIWIGPKLLIILSDPKHIEAVLSSKLALDKDEIYEFIGMVGNGIFVRNGEKWKEFRKPINKMLATKMIESHMLSVFQEKAKKFCTILEKTVPYGELFDVRTIAMNYSLDTFSASLMGHEFNELENNKYDVTKAADEVTSIVVQMMFKPQYNIYRPINRFTAEGRRLIKNGKELWAMCYEMLSTKRQERENPKVNETYNGQPQYFSDFILNMEKKYDLSTDQTSRLMMDFVAAGVDTSAVTVSYVLLLLAMYPEHQEAVYQEQLDVMGSDYERQPSWEDLSKMTYLTRVVKDVIRLYCPPAIFRKLSGDFHFDGYTLPAGSSICISLFALQRNKLYWSHPDEFYPDHFLPEEVAKRPKGSCIPFSSGSRSCPGAQYGMVSVKTLVSVVIRKYKFNTDLKFENLEYKQSFIPEPVQGFMISATPRVHG